MKRRTLLPAVFLMMGALASAQNSSPYTFADTPSRIEPKLPVADLKACPLSNRVDGAPDPVKVKIAKTESIYSTWEDNRVAVGALNVGDDVTVWSGTNVTREPDKAQVLQPSQPDGDTPALKPGDEILSYGLRGNGDYISWAKGKRFEEYYEFEGDSKGGCGFADKSQCTFALVKRGIQEWWVKVKTGTGLTGWVLAGKHFREKAWSDANFGDLCSGD